MYGKGYEFTTKQELKAAIEARTGDDGTANTWNVSAIRDMSFLFDSTGFDEKIDQWDTSNVTTMEGMFMRCFFNKDISKWNVSNVTNMRNMFKRTIFPNVFNYPLPWDVSKVTTMEGMFENAIFNHPLEWNTSSLVVCKNMFKNSEFNQPLRLNVSNVENMESMFQSSKFDQDVSEWVTSSVTNMNSMFSSSKFNHPLPWDVAGVNTMEGMFYNSSFNHDISGWDIEAVTNMSHMFEYSRAFNQDISGWKIRKGTNMVNMFSESSIDEKNKPPIAVFPDKEIKKKITIWVKLHGTNLQTKLPDGLPLHISLATRPGTCTFWYRKTSTEILDEIEKKKLVYQGKPIHVANDASVEQYQPYKEMMFDENEEKVMKGSPGYTKEELKALHQERTSPLRSLVYDRNYSFQDDDGAIMMGIYIISAQNEDGEIEFTYPDITTTSDVFTPTRQPYVKGDYLELQKRNLFNVAVANHIVEGGFRRSDVSDDFSNITHYENVTLSDILLFFGKLGYDFVNIIDDACRSEISAPSLHRAHSNQEHSLHDMVRRIYPTIGGTRKHKKSKHLRRKKLRSIKNKTRRIIH
jgi:surface protein